MCQVSYSGEEKSKIGSHALCYAKGEVFDVPSQTHWKVWQRFSKIPGTELSATTDAQDNLYAASVTAHDDSHHIILNVQENG